MKLSFFIQVTDFKGRLFYKIARQHLSHQHTIYSHCCRSADGSKEIGKRPIFVANCNNVEFYHDLHWMCKFYNIL